MKSSASTSNVQLRDYSSEITTPLTYYGRYLFAHSPTYSRWVRLTSKDIHTALRHRTGFEGQDIWFYLNHPVRWVRIVGIVVAYDNLESRYNLTLDDGSGHQIELVSWKTPQPGTKPQKFTPADLTGVKLYSIVKAKGTVNEFWGRRQVVLKRVTVLKNTNDEVAAWAETTKFKRDILCKPWVVSDEVIAQEKRKLTTNAEDEGRRREKKRRRLERAQEKEEDRRIKAVGKENMLSDRLVRKPHGKEEQAKAKRKVREGSKVLSPKRERSSVSVKPVNTSGISYRGRRRSPGHRLPLPPPLLPPLPLLPRSLIPLLPSEPPRENEEILPIAASSFRGRRRANPAPISNLTLESFLTKPTPGIRPDPSRQLPQPPESTCRDHRQDLQVEKPQHNPGVEIDAPNITTISNLNPEREPTYRGRRWTSKPLEDTKESQTSALSLKPRPSELSYSFIGTSSYRGRRRTSKLLADTLTSNTSLSTPVLPEPSTQTSHRERWRITRAQREAETQTVMPSSLPMDDTLYLSGVYNSIYPERGRAQEEVVSSVPEAVDQEPVKRSAYRGKRRGEKPPVDAIALELSHVPTFTSSAGSHLSGAESPSYHGRQRTEKPLTYSFELPTSMSSFAPTPPLEEISSYRGRRRSKKPQSSQ